MQAIPIIESVHWVGAVDWDRRLFDALIPLPHGTSYNAYLIQGRDKTALIDAVDPAMTHVLLDRLANGPPIDYIISQHAEQDHSGAIPDVLAVHPHAQIVCSPQGRTLLAAHLDLAEAQFVTVDDGDLLPLGGKTLQFIHTPWVHWPETISTYLREDRILFSGDWFGSHLATSDPAPPDHGRIVEAAKRYYAEIMMPFRSIIQRNMEKIDSLEIAMIAPSHGPVYRNPTRILDACRDWISDEPKNLVVVPYISMHGSTRLMVDRLVDRLSGHRVPVQRFDLSVTDLGELAMSLVDAATLVIGTPTFHRGPHPTVFYTTHLANALRPRLAYVSVIGSYGWSTRAVEEVNALIPNLKVEVLEPVLARGYPSDESLAAVDELADTIAQNHADQGWELPIEG
jgi:flavorubredoxin